MRNVYSPANDDRRPIPWGRLIIPCLSLAVLCGGFLATLATVAAFVGVAIGAAQ